MATPVRIDVVSDVICPWCFIGKRRLEKALGQLNGEIDPRITWLPFQLNPDMPGEGIRARNTASRSSAASSVRARSTHASPRRRAARASSSLSSACSAPQTRLPRTS